MAIPVEKQELAALRASGLILTSAMLYQEVLSQKDKSICGLKEALGSGDSIGSFIRQWDKILESGGFSPIFEIARDILNVLSIVPSISSRLNDLASRALQISTKGSALRHDLLGRIFHKLLSDAKYLGTFYTKIPAATILLKLAIDKHEFGLDWVSPASFKHFTIVDLSCGTGSLLKAALSASVDKYIARVMKAGKMPSVDLVHKCLVENGLWGFDILAAAVHIAATAIVMNDSHVPISTMNLYRLPLGVYRAPEDVPGKSRTMKLGSLEFAKGRDIGLTRSLSGNIMGASVGLDEASKHVSLPEMQLCTMNPPFTRSVYNNLLFGNIEQVEDRKELQDEMKRLLVKYHLDANITAGLGSVFVAIADKYLAPGGVLALVLPRAVLNGSAWLPTRNVFSKYQIEYVIASHDFGNYSFSESSGLSEVLLVMQKRDLATSAAFPKHDETIFVNLWKQPKTAIEALAFTHCIEHETPARLSNANGTTEIIVDSTKYAEISSMRIEKSVYPVKKTRRSANKQTTLTPAPASASVSWALPVSFAQTDLNRVAYHLKHGIIFIPSKGIVGSIETVKLSLLAVLGPDGRDIYDGFEIPEHVNGKTVYPALWGMDASSINSISTSINGYLEPLATTRPGRKLRDARLLWSRAGSLLLPKELGLSTNSVAAVILPEDALSNVWWPTRWNEIDGENRHKMERYLAMWLNSTLGFFTLLMERQETAGPWIKFPKTWYSDLEILNFKKLASIDLVALDSLWTEIHDKPFKPFTIITKDATRARIDEVFAKILNIPGFSELRQLLDGEPILSSIKCSRCNAAGFKHHTCPKCNAPM